MNIEKGNRGITIIALIVTIIVLLILAGVSITFLVGDNGILEKAQSAKVESEKAKEIEKMNLKIQSVIASKNGVAKLTDLNEFVNSSSGNYDNEITLNRVIIESDTKAILKMDGYAFTINDSLKTVEMNNVNTEDIYLYKKGDLCTSVTDGWDKYVQGYGAQVTFNTDRITMQTLNINYWGHDVITKKEIELNNYKKLCLEYSSSSGYYTSAWNGSTIHFSVLDQSGNVVKTMNSAPSTVNKIIELDISDLQGLYKVIVEGGSLSQVDIYNIWIKQQ